MRRWILVPSLVLLLTTPAISDPLHGTACDPANVSGPKPQDVVASCTAALRDTTLTPDQRVVALMMRGGTFYHRLNRLDDAIADFTGVIAIRPEYTMGWKFRAIVYALKGDLARAEKDDQSALAIVPDNAEILAHSCSVRAGLKEFDAAVADCSKSISIAPRNSTVFDARALIYAEKGDYPNAIKDYDAALTINPRNAYALLSRSIAKRHIGDIAGSQADLVAARKINPNIEKVLQP